MWSEVQRADAHTVAATSFVVDLGLSLAKLALAKALASSVPAFHKFAS